MRPDIDLVDGRFYAGERGDPRDAYTWMRAHEPVFRDRDGTAGAASYAAVIDAERDADLFSNAGGIRPEVGPLPHMIDMDDPEHLHRRKLVNAGFTRRQVEAKIGGIGRICDELIDAVIDRGECDFVRDLAAPLPMAVIGDMLGVRPQEREMFLQWSDDLVEAQGSNASEEMLSKMMAAYVSFVEFTMRTIEQRRREPTEDLTSVLVHAEIDGRRLTEEDIVAETLLILVGGDETTRHVLSGGMEQLMRHPEQRDQLVADRSLIPQALEEMVRWVSPVKNMCRTVTRDVEFHGTRLRAGEKMLLLFESANFDESVFENPARFDASRNPNPHVAFGFGSHFCLGNQLARLEGRLMFERLLERIPNMELASDLPLPRRPANFVTGLEKMPVRW
ncbi:MULTISPECIES: cytochrome P450 [Rhodococcus]|jgi:cholest-4-en-3-one 26-monooxygenase|uniref:cytochrome P450 n=1 Tax=Rhodococcus TaxID=1827 RepID=UPI000BDD4B3A|nr:MULTISPECIES: cytochrome P450 [Rhodococcus]MBP1160783.1 cytochrome P450 family 142 subfamily A polypeptide 1 [Rhodococcus sp. PvR099]MCZ4559102.1 cytochrome P450 [Rhodococcus maanshanensis]PTR36271.1 cytochrome P450 family 142 subfamily A polypeptide 1 [Rhodococcus sp. OK611]SNX94027.1 cytochrome P450, family 142, subfamily A, polypeptide 1 [Rhodococcus sp. OK270]